MFRVILSRLSLFVSLGLLGQGTFAQNVVQQSQAQTVYAMVNVKGCNVFPESMEQFISSNISVDESGGYQYINIATAFDPRTVSYAQDLEFCTEEAKAGVQNTFFSFQYDYVDVNKVVLYSPDPTHEVCYSLLNSEGHYIFTNCNDEVPLTDEDKHVAHFNAQPLSGVNPLEEAFSPLKNVLEVYEAEKAFQYYLAYRGEVFEPTVRKMTDAPEHYYGIFQGKLPSEIYVDGYAIYEEVRDEQGFVYYILYAPTHEKMYYVYINDAQGFTDVIEIFMFKDAKRVGNFTEYNRFSFDHDPSLNGRYVYKSLGHQ